MGADPVIDESHNRWLHVHVRPPVSGMLKVRGPGQLFADALGVGLGRAPALSDPRWTRLAVWRSPSCQSSTTSASRDASPANQALRVLASRPQSSSCDATTAAAQVLKTSTAGNTFSNLGRQLLDGHWVLSFIDADRCAAARDLVDAGQVRRAPRTPLPQGLLRLCVRSCRHPRANISRWQ